MFPANESVHLYKRSKRNSREVPNRSTHRFMIHNFGMVESLQYHFGSLWRLLSPKRPTCFKDCPPLKSSLFSLQTLVEFVDASGIQASQTKKNIQYINTHRIHGAGIYANIGGILMDPCYHIHSIHGSYGIWLFYFHDPINDQNQWAHRPSTHQQPSHRPAASGQPHHPMETSLRLGRYLVTGDNGIFKTKSWGFIDVLSIEIRGLRCLKYRCLRFIYVL